MELPFILGKCSANVYFINQVLIRPAGETVFTENIIQNNLPKFPNQCK